MKKIFIISLLVTTFFSLSAQYHFDDGSFETKWKEYTVPGGLKYLDYSQDDEDDLIMTMNLLIELTDGSVTTGLSAFRQTGAQNGNYAISVKSVYFETMFVPGVMGSIPADFAIEYLSSLIEEGIGRVTVTLPFVHKPVYLKGYYKYTSVNKDSATIELDLLSADGTPVAKGKFMEHNTVSTWTPFLIDIKDVNPSKAITDIKLLFVASAGYNFDDLMKCKGQAGSELFIDNISFLYERGLEEPLTARVPVKVFPNPAKDQVYFEFSKDGLKGNVIIYNELGLEVGQAYLNGNKAKYDVSHLSAGTYYYRLLDGKMILSSGEFIVQ